MKGNSLLPFSGNLNYLTGTDFTAMNRCAGAIQCFCGLRAFFLLEEHFGLGDQLQFLKAVPY